MLQEIPLSQGRRLFAREIRTGSRDWVVCLPGSGPELFDLSLEEERALTGPLGGPNLLVVNKPGVRADGSVNSAEFERSFRRPQRVRDYLQVLRDRIPGSRARVYLMGFSEGAYLAPEIAVHDRRVRALCLLSGGTRSWLDEEIYKAKPARLGHVLRRVGRVYARPQSASAHWHGITNATWTSYDNDATFESLRRLRIPVFAAHGTKDELVDVESARRDLARLRAAGSFVISRVFEGADHTLEHGWMRALKAGGALFGAARGGKFSSTQSFPRRLTRLELPW